MPCPSPFSPAAGSQPLWILVAALAVPATVGPAQEPPALGLGAGFTSYDLAGTGSAFVVNAVADLPLQSFLMFQPGIAYFRYDARASLYPELSVQLQMPGRHVNPYLGAGAGWALPVEGRPLRDNMDVTLHAVLGARGWFPGRWGVQGEARLRAINPFTGMSFDVTFGVHYRLRRMREQP